MNPLGKIREIIDFIFVKNRLFFKKLFWGEEQVGGGVWGWSIIRSQEFS